MPEPSPNEHPLLRCRAALEMLHQVVPDHDAQTQVKLNERANRPKPKPSAPNELENRV